MPKECGMMALAFFCEKEAKSDTSRCSSLVWSGMSQLRSKQGKSNINARYMRESKPSRGSEVGGSLHSGRCVLASDKASDSWPSNLIFALTKWLSRLRGGRLKDLGKQLEKMRRKGLLLFLCKVANTSSLVGSIVLLTISFTWIPKMLS